MKCIYVRITQQWCSLKRVTKETRGNWRRVNKLGQYGDHVPGPRAGHHPTSAPHFGAEVSYTIRKHGIHIKQDVRCFSNMSGPVFLFPGLSSEQPKTILCFAVSRNWGMTAGRDTLSKDEFLAQLLLGFILISRLHNGVRLKCGMDHMEYSRIPLLSFPGSGSGNIFLLVYVWNKC